MSANAVRAKWDQAYAACAEVEPAPAAVLAEHAHLLPSEGVALDVACGLGGNALFLARKGLRVSAWDISPVALAKLAARAGSLGLKIQTQERDVATIAFPHEAFEVVTVSHFLDRSLTNALIESLKPGGLLFYQTYLREKLNPAGPCNPEYLLGENELLSLFGTLRVLFYREDGRVGDLTVGDRNEASFIGQKRLPSDL